MKLLTTALLLTLSVKALPAQTPAAERFPSAKWLLISHLDSGQSSNDSFTAWLDTTHVERLPRGYLGAWMLTILTRSHVPAASHLLIDCNRRRFDADHFYSYNAKGERTGEAVLYQSEPKPISDDVRNWEDVDPMKPNWEALVALEACRRWAH